MYVQAEGKSMWLASPWNGMVVCMYSPNAAVKTDVCCSFSFPKSIDASYTLTESLVVCHVWNQEMKFEENSTVN